MGFLVVETLDKRFDFPVRISELEGELAVRRRAFARDQFDAEAILNLREIRGGFSLRFKCVYMGLPYKNNIDV